MSEEGESLPGRWWQDRDLLYRELQKRGFDQTRAANEIGGITNGTLSKWWLRHGLEPLQGGRKAETRPFGAKEKGRPRDAKAAKPGVEISGDAAIVVSDAIPAAQNLGDVAEIVRGRGLDPDEWDVERVKVNEWQGFMRGDDDQPLVVTLRQLTAHLKRRVPLDWVFPAVEVTQRFVPGPSPRTGTKRLVMVAGDQQAPYHDEELHAAVCSWLADLLPDEIALNGDTCDLPTVSRHPDRPKWAATVQECVNAAFGILSDYRDASPGSRMRKLRGNHDYRLESELLSRAERMFGIKPAEIPGEAGANALSLRHLLHLDKLGVELVGLEGDHWQYGQLDIAPGLVVRHKPPTKQGRRVKASVMAGDSHRQSIECVTEWDDGEPIVRTIVHVGTLARIREGLGYALDPDWQQGFATVAIGEDSRFGFDLATWRDGRLTWRGDVWRP